MQLIILDLFNNIYETGKVPRELKEGTIYPVPKDTTKPCTSDNARPLTMLESGLKILTHCLANRINNLLIKSPIYAPIQYAFLPGKNITDPLHLIEHAQSNARTQKRELHQAFLDLSQAFDRLEYWASDMALKRMNYPPQFTTLIEDLNTDSQRRIITKDGVTSQWTLQCGVAQGEVLSPIRFITLMDMLATWILLRCNKQNPQNKEMGYKMTFKPEKRKLKLASRTPTGQQQPGGSTDQHPTTISGLMYCDDIALSTETFEDMQDLIGVVSEFMNTFGIQLNNKKSLYTARMPETTKTHPHNITTSPTTEGTWIGGINGTWTPEPAPKTRLTIRQGHEHIRYLGVHFSMDGNWDYQLKLLEDTLHKSLRMIRLRDLPPHQLTYLLNAIIMPKLTYPLNVTSILTGTQGSAAVRRIDRCITEFTKLYLGYPTSINHSFLYTPAKHRGGGLEPLEDLVNINTITNTTITLNDWDTNNFWRRTIDTHNRDNPNSPHDNTHQCYLMASNQFTKILQRTLAEASTLIGSHLPYLKGHLKGNNTPEDLANNLAHRFSKMGYSLDTIMTEPKPTAHRNPLIRTLTTATYGAMASTLMTHNLWHMGDFTIPSGTHLDTWENYNKWEMQNGTRKKPKSKWFKKLERETLIDPTPNSDRTLKRDYRDFPCEIDTLRPFCFHEEDTLVIAFPSPERDSEEKIRVRAYNTEREGEHWAIRLTERKDRIITLENGNTSLTEGALIPMEGLISENIKQGTIILTNDTVMALSEQCKTHTQINLTRAYAGEESEGSMASDTDNEEESEHPDMMTTPRNHQRKKVDIKFNTCSDGSVYEFTNGNTAAGYAAVTEINGIRSIKRYNMAPHPPWKSESAVLNYNPETTRSTDVEAKGLLVAIDEWFPEGRMGTHVHVLDNLAVLHQIATPTRTKNDRHAFREYNHFTIDEVRRKLERTNFYEKNPADKNIHVNWIKGHSGNKLHECADRHAARAAFRPIDGPSRTPKESKFPYALYFYECLITGDIRKHVKKVCQEIHFRKWRNMRSQGVLAKLTMSTGSKIPDYKGKGTRTSISKFFAKLINSVAHTPHMSHKIGKEDTPACPLCQHHDATAEHILLHCPSRKLNNARKRLDKTLLEKLQVNTHQYNQPHQQATHPIEQIPNIKLYPYTTFLHHEPPVQIVNGLPESRWYRKSESKKGMITIQHPDQHADEPIIQKRIPISNFWTLIAWHDLTWSDRPEPLDRYDKRAADIWQAIADAEVDTKGAKLCWAADRMLLDILIDELGCEKELFSNILNTYHRFKTRRMLQRNENFAKHAGIEMDGLDPDAYEYCVYGNPPFDGNTQGKNTIIQTLNAAEQASENKESFRAVFFLPLSDSKLEGRLKHPRARLLIKFPNNSVPFIPDGYWHGGKKAKGCYQQKHTHMVLIMYESKNIGTLQPIDNDTLQRKLAAWFINKTPTRNHVIEKLRYTGIPLKYYDTVLRARFPESWKFWKHRDHTENTTYHGALHDTTHINQTPFKDITEWNRMSAHVGHLPESFDKLLRELGIPALLVKPTTKYVEQAMKAHTVKMFKMYWKATKDGNEQPIEPEMNEDNDNESEISEHVEDPMSITHELTHLARSETDPSSTDEYTTSDETDSENDEEADDDNNLTELTRGEQMLQITRDVKEIDIIREESGQEQTWGTQSEADPSVTDDCSTSSEPDSGRNEGNEDDSPPRQTRRKRPLQMTKEAKENEKSENNARNRRKGLQRAPNRTTSPDREAPQSPS